MSAQPALKHTYLSVLAAAGLGGIISIAGSVFTSRNTVTTEQLDRRLQPITDTLARHEKLLEKMATKAEMDKGLNEMDKKLNQIQRTLNKKTRCFLG
jgi:hypothetical protein